MPAGDTPIYSTDRAIAGKSTANVEMLGSSQEGVLAVGGFAGLDTTVDEAANDSDKTITVPAGEVWELLAVYVDFTASATVGTRSVILEIRNASAVIFLSLRQNINISASQHRACTFAPFGNEVAGAINESTLGALPIGLYLPTGWDLRVRDFNAIDAAADDLLVRVLHKTFTL